MLGEGGFFSLSREKLRSPTSCTFIWKLFASKSNTPCCKASQKALLSKHNYKVLFVSSHVEHSEWSIFMAQPSYTALTEFTSKISMWCIPASKSPQEITGRLCIETVRGMITSGGRPALLPITLTQAGTAATVRGWEISIWLFQGNQGEKRQHLCLKISTYKAGICLALKYFVPISLL